MLYVEVHQVCIAKLIGKGILYMGVTIYNNHEGNTIIGGLN